MTQEPQKKTVARVSLVGSDEIARWCREFRCTEEELRRAVQAVGGSASAVKRYLTNRV